MKHRVGFVVLVLALAGCGKEIGRIALTGEGEGSATIPLAANDKLALWTSLDAEWTGSWGATYAVELLDASRDVVASTTCNPFVISTRIRSVETTLGAHHMKRYEGKMECSLVAPSTGTFTLHTKLTFTGKPIDLKVKDASFVVKI